MDNETKKEDPMELEQPKYFGQMNPDKANSEEYKALYKYQKIDALADRVLELEKEKSETEEKYKRAIIVPKADDKEGVAAFAKALGVPDDASEYELPFGDQILPLKQTMKNAQLTRTQAKLIGRALLEISKNAVTALESNRLAQMEGFDGSLAALHTELQSEVDRKSAAESDKKIFAAFLAETGLKETLEKNGMAYNPGFAKAIASWARSHTGQKHIASTPAAGEGKSKPAASPYGEAFNKQYGYR